MKRIIVEIVAAAGFFAAGWFGYQRTHPAAASGTNQLAERLSAARVACDYVTASAGLGGNYGFGALARDGCVGAMLDHGDLGRCMGARVDAQECQKATVEAMLTRTARPASAKRTKPAGSPSPSKAAP